MYTAYMYMISLNPSDSVAYDLNKSYCLTRLVPCLYLQEKKEKNRLLAYTIQEILLDTLTAKLNLRENMAATLPVSGVIHKRLYKRDVRSSGYCVTSSFTSV